MTMAPMIQMGSSLSSHDSLARTVAVPSVLAAPCVAAQSVPSWQQAPPLSTWACHDGNRMGDVMLLLGTMTMIMENGQEHSKHQANHGS